MVRDRCDDILIPLYPMKLSESRPKKERDASDAAPRPSRLLRDRWILALLLGCAVGGAAAQAKVADTIAQRTLACTACHGKEGRATSEGYFPRIAGKPAGYLYNQLINFREGRRRYPMMTYMVSHLSDDYLQEMAAYFSSQHPPYPPPQAAELSASQVERGRVLATQGDTSRRIPACVSCHGERLTGVEPAVPGLIGLPRDYLAGQFGAWKNGARRAAAPDCMAQISSRLSAEDIAAVTAWLASQPIPADTTPAPAGTAKLPIACGSVPQ